MFDAVAPAVDLVTNADIADRLGLSPHTIVQWRARFKGEFPEPKAQHGMAYVWEWADVYAWLKATGRAEMVPDEWKPKGRKR